MVAAPPALIPGREGGSELALKKALAFYLRSDSLPHLIG